MKLFPSIDLRNGNVVRLMKGDFDSETQYGNNPVSIAEGFAAAGAEWIHVVDLDAARTGEARNRLLIAAIAAAVDVPVQAGGGVRDRESAERLLETGAARIVLGTAATEQFGLVEFLAQTHPHQIAVGLDARDGRVASRGWEAESPHTVADLVRRYNAAGVAAYIVTDIDRDGTQAGPDTAGLTDVLALTDIDVIASGGVGSLADLESLAQVSVAGYKQLAGAIVGRALYEGTFTVSQAVAACR